MRTLKTLEGFIASKSSGMAANDKVEILSGAAGRWSFTGVTGEAPSQSPTDLGAVLVNDASGNQWSFDEGQSVEYSGVQYFPLPFGSEGFGTYIYSQDTWSWAQAASSEVSGGLSFLTLNDAIASTAIKDGDRLPVKEHTQGFGGAGIWYAVPVGTTPNVDLPNGFSVVSCTGVPSLVLALDVNTSINPRSLGATDGIGVDDADSLVMRTANSALMSFMFDKYRDIEIRIDILIRCYGSIMLYDGQTVIGTNRDVAGILGYHPTEPTFIDDTLDAVTASSTFDVMMEKLTLTSQLSDKVFYFTPYKSTFRDNFIRCEFGVGFKLHDAGYQVANRWDHNLFYGCLYGIEGIGGSYGPTDNYFIDNTFFADQLSINAIRLTGASGSTFRGNHYSGGNQKEYVKLSSSLNVRFIGEYFEFNIPENQTGISNPHVTILGGSEPNITFTGCDFWKGTGTYVDYDGDPACSTKVELSIFNKFYLSYASCAFSGGSGDLPIVGFTNGGIANSTNYKVSFDSSNIVNGTYALMGRLTASCTLAGNVVQTDHPYFAPVISTANGAYTTTSGGEVYSTYGATGTTTVVLPGSTGWVTDKPLIINNVSSVATLSFSAIAGLTVGGLNPCPTLTRVKVIRDITGSYDYLVAMA